MPPERMERIFSGILLTANSLFLSATCLFISHSTWTLHFINALFNTGCITLSLTLLQKTWAEHFHVFDSYYLFPFAEETFFAMTCQVEGHWVELSVVLLPPNASPLATGPLKPNAYASLCPFNFLWRNFISNLRRSSLGCLLCQNHVQIFIIFAKLLRFFSGTQHLTMGYRKAIACSEPWAPKMWFQVIVIGSKVTPLGLTNHNTSNISPYSPHL